MHRYATAPRSTCEELFLHAAAAAVKPEAAAYPPVCGGRAGDVSRSLGRSGAMIVHVRPGDERGSGPGDVGHPAHQIVRLGTREPHLVRELVGTGRVDLRAFYARRSRRLLPAAAVALLVTVLWSAMVLPPLRVPDVAGDTIAAAFYVSNVEQYLIRADVIDEFCASAASLPLDASSTFIRSERGGLPARGAGGPERGGPPSRGGRGSPRGGFDSKLRDMIGDLKSCMR